MISKNKLLLNTLFTILWFYSLYGGVVDLLPVMAKIWTPLKLLADATLIFLGVWAMHRRKDIVYAVAFLVGSYIVTCLYNSESLLIYINGLRSFIPLLFTYPLFRYFFDDPGRKDLLVARFNSYVSIFLIIQIPFTIVQFLIHGAGDMVGGSIGSFNSGILTTLVYLFVFYRISNRYDQSKSYWSNLIALRLQFLYLIPTFLNETKVGFVYLLLLIIILMPIDRRAILKLPFIILFSLLLLWIMVEIYMVATGGNSDFLTVEYYTEMYLLNDDSIPFAQYIFDQDKEKLEDVPRFTKLLVGHEVLQSLGRTLTGVGIGQFMGNSGGDLANFATTNRWFMVGSIPYLFTLMIQLGWLGIFVIARYIGSCISAIGWFRYPNSNLGIFLLSIFVILLFYNDSFNLSIISIPFIYLLFYSTTNNTNDID